jgi:sugar phosphate isomerase/epimerase
VQLYTIRKALDEDFDGSLAKVAAAGYAEVELAGLHGKTAAEFRRALDRVGLVAPSSHVPLERVQGDALHATLDEAHTFGHRYLIVPDPPKEYRTVEGMKRLGDELSRIGAAAQDAGVRIGYHNHSEEFRMENGVRPYDALLEYADPRYVAMEMDLFWAVKGGGDPLAYFAKHPGRFRMVHVKDMGPPPARAMMDVGSGVIDWRGIFAHADQAGIEHWFVEHDEPVDAFASIRASHDYLARLEF